MHGRKRPVFQKSNVTNLNSRNKMSNNDEKMLQSALWHISNSVTNGKSQTAECEITKWLKDKLNSLPAEQPSKDLEEAANKYAYSHDTIGISKYTFEREPCSVEQMVRIPIAHEVTNAVKFGANWQKQQTINKACEWLEKNCSNYEKLDWGEGGYTFSDFQTEKLIKDFKQAMEGEQ